MEAQDPVYEQVCRELVSGRKDGHWMWFIFPQIKGLGHSPMSRRYALSSLEEAREYLRHPLLGSRLIQCTQLVNEIRGRSAEEIFGHTDSLKFRSSMTLFDLAAPDMSLFEAALGKYYGGSADQRTVELVYQ